MLLWIGVAIAVAFVLLLVVRAMGGGEEAVAPTPAPAKKALPDKGPDKAKAAGKSERPKGKSEREEDEPEGSKVASIPPPRGSGKAVTKDIAEPAKTPSPEAVTAKPSGDVAVDIMDVEADDPTGPIALILVTAVGRTDPGRRRKHNEDSYLVLEKEAVFVIADGMGGYAAGEVASQLAVDVIGESFKTKTFVGDSDPSRPRRGDELVRAISMSNTAILTQARANEAQSGMGTTLVSCRFSPNKQRVYIAHVGDSRAYRFRGKEIKQLTMDHTLGAAGITGPAAAKLSRAVGIQDSVEVDLTVDAPQVGDHYMLCSDGLSKMVPDEMIRDIVCEGSNDLQKIIEKLVDTANERGGRDNVTVILIRVQEPTSGPPQP